MHTLIGIAFSHYVEKARWALDRFAVPYDDERVLPFFHFPAVWRVHRGRAGTADRASSKYSTPVLRTPDGTLICDSGDIVRYVSETFAPAGLSLEPGEDGEALEQRVHDRLGPHTRRLGYSAVFERPALLKRMARENVTRGQAAVFSAMVPVAKVAMQRLLNISDEAAARSAVKIRAEFDHVGELLADGRPYLAGDRFTSADIAFACMAAPSLLPPEYSAWMPSPDDVVERVAVTMCELRAHPAGQHALRMFAEERNRVVV